MTATEFITPIHISGEYYVSCECGTLIVSATSRNVHYLLRNNQGVTKIYSTKEACPKQHRLPFTHNVKIAHLEQNLHKNGQRIIRAISKFKNGRKEILQFCVNGEEPAIELVEDCPALAYLIACNLFPHTRPELLPGTIQNLLTKKRKYVLREMNWPEAKWVHSILRKVPARECSEDMFHAMHGLLTKESPEAIKTLRHMRQLTRIGVKLMADEDLSPYFAYSFYEAICQTAPDDDYHSGLEIFVLFKSQLLEAIANGFPLSPLRSVSDLEKLHERFIQIVMRPEHYDAIYNLVFPPPPFPKKIIKSGNAEEFGIFPLTTGADLWMEGVKMNHCIAAYSIEIHAANGLMYAYHVKLPNEPPATVMLRRHGKEWCVEELKGKRNQKVSDYVNHWVKNWLRNACKTALNHDN